jgi:hypothetical protein
MTRIPSSFFRAPARSHPAAGAVPRPFAWLLGCALLIVAGALSPAIGAAYADAPASIINATTGQSDAASVVPIAACPPSTPVRATCAAQILGVRGSGTFVHPRLRQPASPYRFRAPRARGSHAAAAAVAAAAEPQPGTPAYLQQAYDLSYLSQTAGTTTTIAIVDAFDDPTAESDLAAYRSKFGLAPCAPGNGCFSEYDQTGGNDYPTATDSNWELETSIDLDAVSALCPNCHIDLIEANSNQVTDLAAAQAEAGSLPGVTVISDSWDLALSGWQAREFASSGQYSFQGITTIAASGDAGYPGGHYNDFPAALPDVTAAGGTTLVPASTNGVQSVREFTETAWSGAGSGCNWAVSQPRWQPNTGCNGRSYTDISADADPDTGMQVYDSAAGSNPWVVAGGTSLASPMIAAYYAVVGSAGQGPSWPYLNASALNDPSTGSNNNYNSSGNSCTATLSYICNSGPGYDGPTGIGSISGAVAPGAPGIAGPGTNGSYAESVTADTAQLQGGVYPNGSNTTYWWEYGTTTSYGQQTPVTDAGAGSTPQSVTGFLTGLQPATTYHYRLVAQNSVGTEYGYDFTFTIAPSSTSSPAQSSPATQPPATTTTSGPTVSVATGSGSTGGSTLTAPDVTRVRVAAAGANNATISGTVATHGAETTYALSYGPTAALGRRVSSSLTASSSQAANVSWNLRNLSPGKTYYLRAVVSNAAGSSESTVIAFRTSPVTITRIAIHGNQLQILLRCYGSAPCRVRLQGRSGNRVFGVGQVSVRGNRSHTVTLKLSRAFQTLSPRGKRAAKLLVLSSWNGVTATVSKTI